MLPWFGLGYSPPPPPPAPAQPPPPPAPAQPPRRRRTSRRRSEGRGDRLVELRDELAVAVEGHVH
jgi:hypothetical protein